MTTTSTAAKSIEIRFTADKNGRRVAHRWSTGARRWITVGTQKADMMISMGEAHRSSGSTR